MNDDEKQPEEEDEFERRFRELEEKAAQIRAKATAPEPPVPTFTRKPESSTFQPSPRKSQGNDAANSRGFGIALAIGYSFVGPLLAGIIIGSLIDGHPGGPATIAGILIGTVLAFVLLIRLVNKLNQQ